MAEQSARTLVDSMIKTNRIMVFSKSYCPYCHMAIKALDKVTKDYMIMQLEGRADCDAIQDVLFEMTGARSVPRVFVGGKCIGGGTETADLERTGKLLEMIRKSEEAAKQ